MTGLPHPHQLLVHKHRDRLSMVKYLASQGQNGLKLIHRDGEMAIAASQGWYNQLFFDLCADEDLTSLSLAGSYSPVFDLFGVEYTNVEKVEEYFLTYIGPDGTAAGSPSSGIMTDPCDPPNEYEYGGCKLELEGWTQLGRSSPVRDITTLGMIQCENQPTYRLDGSPITDEFEFDMVGQVSTMLHDAHRYIIIGDGTLNGQSDGLEQQVRYGYQDPDTGEACTAMDSLIIDWNGNPVCIPDLETMEQVSVNGNPVTTQASIIDYLNAWTFRMNTRIKRAPRLRTGIPMIIGLMPQEIIAQLVACYVCYSVCGSFDVSAGFADNEDARAERNRLMQQLANGSVTLNFNGWPITLYPWDYELIDPVTGFSDAYFLITRVGNQPLVRLQLKDMRKVVAKASRVEQSAIDGGRILAWSTFDNLCEQRHARMDMRLLLRAPWTALRFTNIASAPIFGHISGDPLSPYFFESNLVAWPAA